MSETAVLLSVLLLISLCAPAFTYEMNCPDGVCGLGEFFNYTTRRCDRCHEGHYMEIDNHCNRDCFRCVKPGDGQAIKVKCTPEKNGKINCTEEDYFLAGSVPYAQHCTPCQKCGQGFYMESPCSETKDTVCSQLPPATSQSRVLETTWQPLSGTPRFPSATPQLPSDTPHLPSDTPQLPSDTPQLPSDTPHLPSATPQLPSATPHLPSDTPHLPSDTPHLPSDTPQLPSATPQLPSATPQLPIGSNISTPAAPVEVQSSSFSPGVIAAIIVVPVVVVVALLAVGVYFLYRYLKSKYAKCPQEEDRGENC